MNGQKVVYDYLESLGIQYEYLEHPAAPTIEIAKEYWKDVDAVHCKNLFFRNHKGNRHYLVVFNCDQNLAIKDLEQRLKQGKLSFASEKRMEKYLGTNIISSGISLGIDQVPGDGQQIILNVQ